jgi:hypothetical protein
LPRRAQRRCIAAPLTRARVRTHSPELKRGLEYAMAHPEEINKVAKVQTQARASRALHSNEPHCPMQLERVP